MAVVVVGTSHNNIVFLKTIAISSSLILILLLAIRDILIRMFDSSLFALAHGTSAINVLKFALLVGFQKLAIAGVGVLWTLVENVAFFAPVTFGAVAQTTKGDTKGGSGRHFHVGVAACRVGAVAAGKESASRGTRVGRVMGEVAVYALVAAAGEKVGLAHRDFVGIVIEATFDAAGTTT